MSLCSPWAQEQGQPRVWRAAADGNLAWSCSKLLSSSRRELIPSPARKSCVGQEWQLKGSSSSPHLLLRPRSGEDPAAAKGAAVLAVLRCREEPEHPVWRYSPGKNLCLKHLPTAFTKDQTGAASRPASASLGPWCGAGGVCQEPCFCRGNHSPTWCAPASVLPADQDVPVTWHCW